MRYSGPALEPMTLFVARVTGLDGREFVEEDEKGNLFIDLENPRLRNAVVAKTATDLIKRILEKEAPSPTA
jgi:hypothetical protein